MSERILGSLAILQDGNYKVMKLLDLINCSETDGNMGHRVAEDSITFITWNVVVVRRSGEVVETVF